MQDNVDATGVAYYPVGSWPILEPESGDLLIDEVGRRSYITSVAYGPSVSKNIALGHLPRVYAEESRSLKVKVVGYRALLGPDNERMKS